MWLSAPASSCPRAVEGVAASGRCPCCSVCFEVAPFPPPFAQPIFRVRKFVRAVARAGEVRFTNSASGM